MATCETCKANKVCDHNKYGFENCNNYISADVVEVKQIEIIRDDLKWWLETNTEKGVVFIPEFVVENMIAKMDERRDT